MIVNLEEQVVNRLKEHHLTITTAESCTGGMVASMLVNAPGASDVLRQAYVTYCDDAKHELLGVSQETLTQYTAVSEQTAHEMATGAAKAARADISIAVTGVAGPGGTKEYPQGLVYIGIYYEEHVIVNQYLFEGDRYEIRKQAAIAALTMVLELVADTPQS